MFIFNEETGKLDIQKMRTNGSLPTDAYKFFDDALVKVAKQELTLVQDLNEYGLVDNSLNLGDTIVSYDKVSDMSPAEVSMDGITRSQNGALSFTEAGVPVPVFRKDFSLTERQIQATSRLSTTGIEVATRVVAESINTTCLNGYGRTVDSFQLYGLKNQGIGPGEVCLSVLSPQIFHSGSKPGAGDIFIEGQGHFEIKASVAKPGRLFDGRKAKVDMNTIQNVRDQLKIEKPRVNLKDLIEANPNQQQVAALAKAIFRHTSNIAPFVNAIMKKDEGAAKLEHTKLAYQNYQNMTAQGKDTFVGIIFMSGAKKWSKVVRSVDDLIQNVAVGTIYVASPDQADLFPQTTYKF